MTPFVILTGASGSGKTALADAIEAEAPGLADIFRFDRIGVPSPDEMTQRWGSGEAWQRAMTIDWLSRIATLRTGRRSVLFEGQMRLAFIREGLDLARIDDAQVILVDCSDEVRTHRLAMQRHQPELASPDMTQWAAFLRDEASQGGYETLDTTRISLAAGAEYIANLLRDGAGSSADSHASQA